MRLARYADIPWGTHPDLRGGAEPTNGATGGTEVKNPSTLYRPLFKGTPGRPGHFEMVVSTYARPKYYPRHRHNIDQVRLTLYGDSDWAPGMATPVGGILYVPAGTYYGPYTRAAGLELFAVQFEGADGAPFVDFDSMLAAQQALAAKGTFAKGVYSWTDAQGVLHNMDGHQAGVEQATGQKETFPGARFTSPIEINPEHFHWADLAPGVQIKRFGTFTDGDVRLAMLGLEAGSRYTLPVVDQVTLLFVSLGHGSVDGEPLSERDGIQLQVGDGLTLAASDRLELLLLGLPRVR